MPGLWEHSRWWMLWLLRSSLQASVLIVLILAAQWLLRRWLSARWRHALWLLVLLRLALPAAPQTRWSLFNLPRAFEGGTPVPRPAGKPAKMPAAPPGPIAPTALTATVEPTGTHPEPLAAPTASPPPRGLPRGEEIASRTPWTQRTGEILLIVWAAGMAVLGLRLVLCNVRFHRRLAQLAAAPSAEALELLRRCKAEMSVRRRLEVLETPAVEIPALFGLFRPRLLLPEGLTERLTTAQLRHVFRHELAHLKRLDVPLDWLATVLSMPHWFNPLVWLALKRMRLDRELACDEAVLARAPDADARSYGQTILELLEGPSHRAQPAGVVAVVENRNQMTRRIEMIAHFRRNRHRGSVLGIGLLLALGLFVLTDARADPPGAAKAADKGETRKDKPEPAKASRPPTSENDAELRRKLTREIERLSFTEIDLKDVIQFLREYSDANLHVNWRALVAAGVEHGTKVSVDVRRIPVRRALELVLRDVSGGIADEDAKLTWAIDGGVTVVSTRQDLSPERAWVAKEVRLPGAADDKASRPLRKKLEKQIDRLSFADIDLKDVIQFLREYSDANVHVNWRALVVAGVEPDTKVTMDLRKVTVKRALEVILRDVSALVGDGPVYAIDGGVLTISTLSDLAPSPPAGGGRGIEAVTALPPGSTRTLAFIRAGRIAKVSVKEGQEVKAGQELIRLDDALEREQLAQLETDASSRIRVRAAEAQLEQRIADLKAMEEQAKAALATKSDVERARAEVRIAQLSVELAKAELIKHEHSHRKARIQLERMRLLSPIDGTVEKVFARVGESVDALAPVVRVVKVRGQALWIDVPVPLPQAAKLKKGQLTLIRRAGKGGAVRGRIVSMASTADAKGGTLRVQVELPNPTARPAGQRVTVTFPRGQ
jgi:RND family efflux transporter MFP subunit